jgi:hypothetical protein
MPRPLLILLILVGCRAGPSAAEVTPPSAPLSVAQYIAALDNFHQIAQKLKDDPSKAADLLQTLPDSSWQVRDEGKDFNIPTAGLRQNVEQWQKTNSDELRERITAQLDTLRSDAQDYQHSPADARPRHVLLDDILARPEFKGVHGPSWLDRLKQRLTEFLIRLLGRAFASSTIPVLGDILVYGLMVLAVLGVAYWMYRSIRESVALETIMPQPLAVSTKQWPIWLREARAASARGDWREAVHLAYWSGISFLEAQGAWRADIARTPREYLRLLPANSERQPALRALTNKLEIVWYGLGEAGPEAFQQTLIELERLGCPCN